MVEQIVARIAGTIDVPVTVDFEGGYSDDDTVLAANVSRLLALGVVGMNFEDRVVQGVGLYAVDRQTHRIAAMRDAAAKQGVNLFINARTDAQLAELDAAIDGTEDLDGQEIVRTKRFSLKPMTSGEAIDQLELLGHDFFVFLNADDNQVNVIYRRKRGDYGLIQPE